jgi:hypothetical protein
MAALLRKSRLRRLSRIIPGHSDPGTQLSVLYSPGGSTDHSRFMGSCNSVAIALMGSDFFRLAGHRTVVDTEAGFRSAWYHSHSRCKTASDIRTICHLSLMFSRVLFPCSEQRVPACVTRSNHSFSVDTAFRCAIRLLVLDYSHPLPSARRYWIRTSSHISLIPLLQYFAFTPSMIIYPVMFIVSLLLPQVAYGQLPRVSPLYLQPFRFPLPIPRIKTALATYINPSTGVPIDFYEVTITPFKKNFFPGLQAADLVGYDGTFPGPMFRIEKGRETLVRFVNKGFRPASVHLHGSFSGFRSIGFAGQLN